MHLQSKVEREHFGKRCTTDSLMRSVQRAWSDDNNYVTLDNAFFRLKNVLCDILRGAGSNNFVELERGKTNLQINIEDI